MVEVSRFVGAAPFWRLIIGFLGCAAVAVGSSVAAAQEFGSGTQGNTVRDRERTDYDADGIRLGSFRLFPTLGVGVQYSDNIFATNGNKAGDAIFTVRPSLRLRSDWSRHMLAFSATGNLGFYSDLTSEDYQDVAIALRGQYDISRTSGIRLSVEADRRHEGRDSPDDVGGIKPTIYYVLEPELELFLRLSNVTVRLKNRLTVRDYEDTLAAGGVLIDEDDRDRLVWVGSLEVGYIFSPSFRGFVRGAYNIRDYDELVDNQGLMRDSDGFSVVGGVTVDITGSLSFDAFIGYRQQSFEDPRFVTFDGITGGLALVWTPTRMTTITAGLDRSVRETTQSNASGVFATEYSLVVDHELLRQLILSVRASVLDREYRGTGRNDTDWSAGFRATYLINRTLNLDFSYDYRTRDSNFDVEDFNRNTASLRLRIQL